MPAVTADIVEVELRARTEAYIAKIAAAERQFTKRMELMASSATQMEKKVSAAGDRMSGSLRRSLAAIGVAGAIKEAQELADAWTASANKLAAAGVPMEKLASTQQRLADLSRETRSEFASTADLYAKLTRATKDLGANEAQVARATETVNKAFKAGGASTQEQVSSILQLSQALGSGLLQGDELRSIRENAPLLARAIAKEFDTTVAGLKKLGAEGKLTSDRVFKAILVGSQQIDDQFAKTRGTIGEAFTALRTEAGRFLNEFDRATGTTKGISEFVNKAADDFDLLAQSVTIAAAVVGTALGTRLASSLGQAAINNNAFVRSLLDGTVGIDKNAEAARKFAGESLRQARAIADSAKAQSTASQQKVAALRAEAAQLQQNIALAAAQRAEAAKGLAAARGNNAAGFGSIAGSSTRLQTDQQNATKALIASRRALAATTKTLAVAEAELAVASSSYIVAQQRVAVGERAMQVALAGTSVVTRAASVAMRGLGVAMSFFGGPIGFAITAVAGALAFFATEAAKAKVAGENAQAVLDDMQSTADQTRTAVDGLTTGQKDNKVATDAAGKSARDTAEAYAAVGNAAANAAELIKYMTAAQRANQLSKIDDSIRDLDKSIGGFNPIATNNEEAVANAHKKVLKQFGVGGTGAGFGASDVFIDQARSAVKSKTATKALTDAVQEYDNALAVLSDNAKRRAGLVAARDVVFRGIDDPTLQRPAIGTGNLIPPSIDPKDKKGGRKGKSAEDLAAMREELALQQRINEARAAGAEELAQFLEDQAAVINLAQQLERAGVSKQEAQAQAEAAIKRLQAAREFGELEDKRAEREKETAKAREDEQERLEDLRRRNLFLQEQELQVQLEVAKASGNSERVKELERQLDLLQRIREFEDFGGLPPDEARKKAEEDQDAVDKAKISGEIRDAFKDGVKAALDGDLSKFLEDFWQDALDRANDRVIDNLFDALEKIDWSSVVGQIFTKGGGISNLLGNLFGGGRAGGGLMKPGKYYRVGENGPEYVTVDQVAKTIPNRQMTAQSQGGGLTIQVVNNTGTPAKADVQRTNGGAKINLEPMFNAGIQGAGRSGALRKGLLASPQPVRRG